MSRVLTVVVLTASLAVAAGCAQYRAAIGSYGAEVSDATLNDAIWTMCRAIPVGAVKRKFDTPERIKLYAEMCNDMELISK